jgi:hypothetical protein
MKTAEQRYMTSFRLPFELRDRLDRVRLARGRRNGGLPPKFGDVVVEALEEFVTRATKANRK